MFYYHTNSSFNYAGRVVTFVKEVMFWCVSFVCLFGRYASVQDCAQPTKLIFMTHGGRVQNGLRVQPIKFDSESESVR